MKAKKPDTLCPQCPTVSSISAQEERLAELIWKYLDDDDEMSDSEVSALETQLLASSSDRYLYVLQAMLDEQIRDLLCTEILHDHDDCESAGGAAG